MSAGCSSALPACNNTRQSGMLGIWATGPHPRGEHERGAAHALEGRWKEHACAANQQVLGHVQDSKMFPCMSKT
eukprot:168783-Chlamydomonas_euryale.AAC.2